MQRLWGFYVLILINQNQAKIIRLNYFELFFVCFLPWLKYEKFSSSSYSGSIAFLALCTVSSCHICYGSSQFWKVLGTIIIKFLQTDPFMDYRTY